GDRVPPDYDNLIAKLMVHAPDREACIDRLGRALEETEIGGVQTTLPFHRAVAGSAAFRAGELSTGWVAEHWDGEAAHAAAARLALLAVGVVAMDDGADADTRRAMAVSSTMAAGPAGDAVAPSRNAWRHGGRAAGTDRWPS
ncbi:MAG: hypothetical protein ABIR11_07675, partial [Candidatus Limnocylindrales bacterium]